MLNGVLEASRWIRVVRIGVREGLCVGWYYLSVVKHSRRVSCEEGDCEGDCEGEAEGERRGIRFVENS